MNDRLRLKTDLLALGLLAATVFVALSLYSHDLADPPAATVYLFTNSARTMFIGGGLVGAFGATTAFFLSYPLEWPMSSTIVLVLGAMFVLGYVFSPKYGLFSRRKHGV